MEKMIINPQAPAAKTFQPARVITLELSDPLPRITQYDPRRGNDYARAIIIVRLHRRPVGIIQVGIPEGGLESEALAGQIWTILSGQINDHLRQDNLPLIQILTRDGLRPVQNPACEQECSSPDELPLVSVIIATRDRAASLEVALDSIFEMDYPNFEVLVVDNAPKTEATLDLIEDRYAGLVSYIREERPGLSVAHNAALKKARGEIVAFTDDDVIVDRDWLKRLVNAFYCTDRVACVTGMILSAEIETPAQAIFEEYGGFSKGYTRKVFDLQENRPDNPLFPYAAGRYGSGANMSFKADFLKEIGGFDPATGTGTPALGGDDLAAFFEVISRGYRLIYEPAAIIFHHHHRDYRKLRMQTFGYGAGLTAFITKTIVDKPTRVFDVARRIPSGILYILSPHSYKNVHKSEKYPKELNRLEYRGMLYGPIAYLRSRWQSRKYHEAFEKAEVER